MVENDLFVNTGYLRDHVSKLRTEKKLVLELQENIKAIKNLIDTDSLYKIQSILQDINRMLEYFDKMAESMERISEDADYLSLTIGRIIEDDTENTQHTTSQAFTL